MIFVDYKKHSICSLLFLVNKFRILWWKIRIFLNYELFLTHKGLSLKRMVCSQHCVRDAVFSLQMYCTYLILFTSLNVARMLFIHICTNITGCGAKPCRSTLAAAALVQMLTGKPKCDITIEAFAAREQRLLGCLSTYPGTQAVTAKRQEQRLSLNK